MRRTMMIVSVAAVVAACGPTTYLSNVTRYHNLAAAQGRTFAIAPEAFQQGSLEFAAFADVVSRLMQANGFRPADQGSGADLVVMFRYGTDDGRVEVFSTPPFAQEWYWQQRFRQQAAIPAPLPAYQPIVSDVQSTTVFTRWVELDILDGPMLRSGRREKLFEGRAVSEGRSRDHTMLPYVIEALFADFPGPNGQTVPVRVVEEPRTIRRQ